MKLHILWDAQVVEVSCHAPRHQTGHGDVRFARTSSFRASRKMQRVTSNLAQPLRAIRAITQLRGVDENDRMGAGE
jgi:hypothetical protein